MNHMPQSQADGYADSGSVLREQVLTEIAATFDLDRQEVRTSCRLCEDFRANLSDLITLKAALEVTFSIEHIPSSMVDRWKTVSDVVTYVEGRLASEAITS